MSMHSTSWLLLSLMAIALPRTASAAECVRPDATAEASEQTRLRGDVNVTVMGFGGGAEAESETQKSWESQLPSQSAVDNQWYLYYLCQEYEARRLTRDQYCAVSGGIWERIVGRPVAMGECASRGATAAPAALATANILANDAPVLAPIPATSATPPVEAQPQATAIPRGRWSMLTPTGSAIDVFGPVRMGGRELWYSENDQGCLSVIQQVEGAWVETILVGECSPWPTLELAANASVLAINAGQERLEFDFTDPAPGRPPDGRWAGALGFSVAQTKGAAEDPVLKSIVQAFSLFEGAGRGRPTSFPVRLTVDSRGGSIAWGVTGCTTTLAEPRKGAGWVQFTEHAAAESGCFDGAKVTLQALSSDAVLLQWAGGDTSAQGVLRLAD